MAIITEYIDAVTLAETKQYLRIDPLDVDLDGELTRMISSACELVEQFSNYRMKPQILRYPLTRGMVRIYDFPIVSIDDPAVNTFTAIEKNLFTLLCDFQGDFIQDNNVVLASVGYDDTDILPSFLVTAVLETVRIWFYNTEDNTGRGILPEPVFALLKPFKRFIV